MTDARGSRLAEDSRRLKGLAHPLRARLAALLVADGPMKVADLAAALGEPANSVSFHLRQLERYGLAARVPSPQGAPAGESWWDGLERSILVDPQQWDDEEADAALEQLRGLLASDARDRVEGLMIALAGERATGAPRTAVSQTFTGRLTDDEAAAYADRLRALLREMAEASHQSRNVDGARLWSFTVVGFPETRYGA